ATFAAITDPEQSWMDYTNPDLRGDKSDYATPKPAPTPEGGFDTSKTINAKSSEAEIKKLQTLLSNLGWLSKDDVSGKYDDRTKQAVADFQKYMNETYAINPKLSVDGIAGAKTLSWLIRVDLSVKPTPTPAPITPSPTNANRVVDENATPEAIRYVQNQLISLNVLPENGATGVYDKATREAVLKFQKRVNDLQGYDALDESGTADAATLAYLDYYVEWWDKNKPSPAPSTAPTPTPAATETADGIDENSAKESIRFVQEMLIDLGYLEGTADGNYGDKTYAAVKSFQTFINAQHGDVVRVTGKADELTLQYLEYYQANLPTPTTGATQPPAASAPEITVTGAAAHENGVYYVGNDGVSIAWRAEGAGSYNIYLYDAGGNAVRGFDNTQYTALNFPQSYLASDGIYALQVVAIPEGGKPEDGAYASVSLALHGAATPTPAAGVTAPEIRVSGEAARENGVYYIEDSVDISWSAEHAAAYSLYLHDAGGNEIHSAKNVDLTATQLTTKLVSGDGNYTFTVIAIPEGGSEADGKRSQIAVARYQAPVAEVTAPEIRVSGEAARENGVYYIEDSMDISWSAENAAAYSLYLHDAGGNEIHSAKNVDLTATQLTTKLVSGDGNYTFTVIAIPEGGSEADGKHSQIAVARYQAPVAEVTAPEIRVSGEAARENGVYYIEDSIDIGWSAEHAAAYSVYLHDAGGNEIHSAKNVDLTATKLTTSLVSGDGNYTFTVIAIPEGGSEADGKRSQIAVARYQAPVAEVTAPEIRVSGEAARENGVYYIEDSMDISWSAENAAAYSLYLHDAGGSEIHSAKNVDLTATQLTTSLVSGDGNYTFTVIAIPEGGSEADGKHSQIIVARYRAPIAEVGAPEITISGHTDYANETYLVGAGGISIAWSAQNAAAYSLYLRDSDNNTVLEYRNVENTSASLGADKLIPGIVYTVTVVAIPAGGDEGDGKRADAMVALAQQGETPAPGYIDANSNPEMIQRMQQLLYDLGWLASATPGTLDAPTLQAVYDFQSYVLAEGINPEISLIDTSAENPTIDGATLMTLADKEYPVHKPQ
ncbi:MAG: peptidoglycan-binding protein, partial [Christensenellales bacterium]